MPGIHNVRNACAAAAVAYALGVDSTQIKIALEAVSPISGRLQPLRGTNGCTLFDDSYNANPLSVVAAAEFLAQLSGADSVTGGMSKTLDELESAIVNQGDGELAMKQKGVDLLADGVEAFEKGENADKADLEEALIQPPVIEAATHGISAAEQDADVKVAIPGAKAGDTVTIHWGGQDHSATVLAGDVDADGTASITVPSDLLMRDSNRTDPSSCIVRKAFSTSARTSSGCRDRMRISRS